MMPIAPLMLEHRLIERMLEAIKVDIQQIDAGGQEAAEFVDITVDFFNTYADRCHHGKEEDILFRLLSEKEVSKPDRKMMEELAEDHVRSRAITNRLLEARNRHIENSREGVREIQSTLSDLFAFYPRHIEKEDRHFFIPSMEYFTAHEQDDMVEAFAEFDRKVIHEKYRSIVERMEGRGKGLRSRAREGRRK